VKIALGVSRLGEEVICINRGMSHSEIGVSRTPKSEHVAH
jgi:hypothetical protein